MVRSSYKNRVIGVHLTNDRRDCIKYGRVVLERSTFLYQ